MAPRRKSKEEIVQVALNYCAELRVANFSLTRGQNELIRGELKFAASVKQFNFI
jgi:hypothetical protein